MTRWGAGRSRRTLGGAAALALIATSLTFLVAPPAAVAAPGDDCGGVDTPPAHHLSSGTRCDGNLDEAASRTFDHSSGYRVHEHQDVYSYSRTDGDAVRIRAGHDVCVRTDPAPGTFVASGAGVGSLKVLGQRSENTDPSIQGPCPNQPGDYWVEVTVTPNDRPTVGHGPVKTSGQVGDTFTFTVSGTDPDGNLKSLGVRFPNPYNNNTDWKSQAIGTSSWSTEFSYQFTQDTEVQFVARDVHGAESPPSASFRISVGHSDCGTGSDAVVEPITVPVTCSGRFGSYTDADAFTFAVPDGKRVRARLAGPEGWVMKLTSPSGATFDRWSGDEDSDLYGSLEQGPWRIDLRGDGDVTDYQLVLALVDPPAPPTLSVQYEPVAHQGDFHPIHMTGTDPNGQTLKYQIDWGNNIRSLWPTSGRAASGQTVTGARKFVNPTPTTHTAVITATNSDGLTASQTITLTLRLHNDCGLGESYDAPGSASGAKVIPSECEGTLGHLMPDWAHETDAADFYQSPHQCSPFSTCRVRVTLTTSPGLAATLVVDDALTQGSAYCSPGCTTKVDSLVPYPASGYPRLSVRLNGGAGWYRLKVEKVPLTALAP